jgi:hypothetical protein
LSSSTRSSSFFVHYLGSKKSENADRYHRQNRSTVLE